MNPASAEPSVPTPPERTSVPTRSERATSSEPSLGTMSPSDLDEVVALEALAFPIPWSRSSFADELARPHARSFVLREGAALVGYLVAWVLFDVAELLVVAVQPDHRGRGHGRRLVTHLLDVARREGATRVQLEVRAGNLAAIALYAQLGFQRVGLRRGYYQDSGEDAVLMDRELDA